MIDNDEPAIGASDEAPSDISAPDELEEFSPIIGRAWRSGDRLPATSIGSSILSPGELRHLAMRLLELADRIDGQHPDEGMTEDISSEERASLYEIARTEYISRRRREAFLNNELFGEPCWDMLLDLFLNHEMGAQVYTKSCLMASGAPDTTALRWLNTLVEKGLVERYGLQSDRRVTMVGLSERGYKKMVQVLRART